MMKNKITSLYVHIPFCNNICGYCDFTKLLYNKEFADKYLLSLKYELESLNIKNKLKTIYVGGGTPTSLNDEQFSFLLSLLTPLLDEDYEFTVEANPESLSVSKIEIMKRSGVNRVSIGVESTNDEILKLIGRKHSFDMVKEAASNLTKLGLTNYSCDLIIGLPHVSKSMLENDINNLISLNPKHISCYSLTVHENTKFGIENIKEPDDVLSREYYDTVNEILESNGFIHYEISNWAKDGYESKHNLVYWKDEEYYAVGLGASSYIHPYRRKNTLNLAKYINLEYKNEEEYVSIDDDKTYFIMLNLRTRYGISFKEYKNKFNEDFVLKHKTTIDELTKSGLLVLTKESIYPTYEGMMLLDQILLRLIV